jgi:hypothetical protein
MQPRRIILANESRFLRELLKRVIDKVPGVQIVAEVTDVTTLSATIEETNARWVIVSLPVDSERPGVIESLLTAHPSIRVLAVGTDGSQVRMRWLEPRERNLDSSSLEDLIAILGDESI